PPPPPPAAAACVVRDRPPASRRSVDERPHPYHHPCGAVGSAPRRLYPSIGGGGRTRYGGWRKDRPRRARAAPFYPGRACAAGACVRSAPALSQRASDVQRCELVGGREGP